MLCKCTSKTASHVFECVSPFPISPLSLTRKWQKDSVPTFDTCPLCFSQCLDNCYGNCMSQRSVDWLIQAVSQTDESFEATCLFRSALVVMFWQPLRWLSPVIMEHIRCEKKHWCQESKMEMWWWGICRQERACIRSMISIAKSGRSKLIIIHQLWMMWDM